MVELTGHPIYDVVDFGTSSPPPEIGNRGVPNTDTAAQVGLQGSGAKIFHTRELSAGTQTHCKRGIYAVSMVQPPYLVASAV